PAAQEDVFEKFRSNYLDAPNSPLLPFGHGLSYTEFQYSDLRLDRQVLGQGETLSATVTLTNTGDRGGEEVVQLYLRDVVRSITPPKRELKAVERKSVVEEED